MRDFLNPHIYLAMLLGSVMLAGFSFLTGVDFGGSPQQQPAAISEPAAPAIPSPAELFCPPPFAEVDRNILADADPPTGYVVCENRPYTLSLTLSGTRLLYELLPDTRVRQITDTEEIDRILAGR